MTDPETDGAVPPQERPDAPGGSGAPTLGRSVGDRLGWHARLRSRRADGPIGRLISGGRRFSFVLGRSLATRPAFKVPSAVRDPQLVAPASESVMATVEPPKRAQIGARRAAEVAASLANAVMERSATTAWSDRSSLPANAPAAGTLPRAALPPGEWGASGPGGFTTRLRAEALPVQTLSDVSAVGNVLTPREERASKKAPAPALSAPRAARPSRSSLARRAAGRASSPDDGAAAPGRPPTEDVESRAAQAAPAATTPPQRDVPPTSAPPRSRPLPPPAPTTSGGPPTSGARSRPNRSTAEGRPSSTSGSSRSAPPSPAPASGATSPSLPPAAPSPTRSPKGPRRDGDGQTVARRKTGGARQPEGSLDTPSDGGWGRRRPGGDATFPSLLLAGAGGAVLLAEQLVAARSLSTGPAQVATAIGERLSVGGPGWGAPSRHRRAGSSAPSPTVAQASLASHARARRMTEATSDGGGRPARPSERRPSSNGTRRPVRRLGEVRADGPTPGRSDTGTSAVQRAPSPTPSPATGPRQVVGVPPNVLDVVPLAKAVGHLQTAQTRPVPPAPAEPGTGEATGSSGLDARVGAATSPVDGARAPVRSGGGVSAIPTHDGGGHRPLVLRRAVRPGPFPLSAIARAVGPPEDARTATGGAISRPLRARGAAGRRGAGPKVPGDGDQGEQEVTAPAAPSGRAGRSGSPGTGAQAPTPASPRQAEAGSAPRRAPSASGSPRAQRFVAELARHVPDPVIALPPRLAPLARALGGDGAPVVLRSGPASAAALAAAGRPAATVGRVVHLARRPDTGPASAAVVAHELVHAMSRGRHGAHRSQPGAATPRFFLDDHVDREEGQARAIGSIVRRMLESDVRPPPLASNGKQHPTNARVDPIRGEIGSTLQRSPMSSPVSFTQDTESTEGQGGAQTSHRAPFTGVGTPAGGPAATPGDSGLTTMLDRGKAAGSGPVAPPPGRPATGPSGSGAPGSPMTSATGRTLPSNTRFDPGQGEIHWKLFRGSISSPIPFPQDTEKQQRGPVPGSSPVTSSTAPPGSAPPVPAPGSGLAASGFGPAAPGSSAGPGVFAGLASSSALLPLPLHGRPPLASALVSQFGKKGASTVEPTPPHVQPSSAPNAAEILEWIVEHVEQRVLEELERRGRRHVPEVF